MALRRTKIVCTLGPASESPEIVGALVAAGMDCARLNFSHGTQAEHGERIRLVREAQRQAGRPLAVMADLQGPKLRVARDFEARELVVGEEVLLYGAGTAARAGGIPVDPPVIAEALEPGHQVLIDDGLIRLEVVAAAGREARARVIVGGLVKARKGVALPGVDVPIPSLTHKDLNDLEFALAQGVDYVALSFVRSAEDVYGLKLQIASLGYDARVVAKIEQAEALDDLDLIAEAADAMMVARGDLGVEIGPERVPLEQKRIVKVSLEHAKPVITATQMLESMVQQSTPTRAEASDVANAILDGSSAIMLSGETANGAYPVEAVETMVRIAGQVDQEIGYRPTGHPLDDPENGRTRAAITAAATELAEYLGAAAIAVPTSSGATAAAVARHRPQRQVIALSSDPRALQRMALYWGVVPLLSGRHQDMEDMLADCLATMRHHHLIQEGEQVVFTAGSALNVSGSTDLIKVTTV